jgi:hypothetical protein
MKAKQPMTDIIVGNGSMLSVSKAEVKKPSDVNVEKLTSHDPFVFWGDDNLLPKRVMEEFGKNEILFRANEFNKSVHGGAGVEFYKEVRDKQGKYIEYFEDNEIMDFFLENEVNEGLYKSFVEDYENLGNIAPEHILSADRKKIARIFRHDISWCRWAKQDVKQREVLELYINSDWETFKKEESAIVPVLNSRFPLMDLERRSSGFNFIQRIRPVTTGRYYFEMCNCEVLMTSDTLAIAADLKRTLRAILKNQATLKWHIEITAEYLEFKYGKTAFNKMQDNPAQYQEAMNTAKEEIDKYLVGPENAAKTMITGCYYDRSGNKIPHIIITPLKNQLEKGAWIPDQEFAANAIYQGMGVDASSVGGFSNQNRTMNSGSEKKNSYEISSATFYGDQQITLAPLVFAARFNGWFKKYPNLKFAVAATPTDALRPNVEPTKPIAQ